MTDNKHILSMVMRHISTCDDGREIATSMMITLSLASKTFYDKYKSYRKKELRLYGKEKAEAYHESRIIRTANWNYSSAKISDKGVRRIKRAAKIFGVSGSMLVLDSVAGDLRVSPGGAARMCNAFANECSIWRNLSYQHVMVMAREIAGGRILDEMDNMYFYEFGVIRLIIPSYDQRRFAYNKYE